MNQSQDQGLKFGGEIVEPIPLKLLFQLKHYPILTENSQKYQYLLTAFLTFLWIIGNYLSLITSFIFMNPLFVCNGEKTTEIAACQMLDQCTVTNSYTAVAYDHLYCDQEGTREFIQMSTFIGTGTAVFVLPFLCDVIGRRKGYILGMCLALLGATILIMGIYCHEIWMLIMGSMIAGMGSNGILTLSYIISTEYFDDRMRQKSIMIYNAGYPFASISFILVFSYLPEWYNYLIFLIIIPLAAMIIISLFFLNESPIFLLIKKPNIRQYIRTIQQISYYNKVDPTKIRLQMQALQREGNIGGEVQSKTKQTSYRDAIKIIFTTRKYIKAVFCLGLSKMGYNIFYFGVQNSMERFGFSFGVGMSFVGGFQFVALISGIYVIEKIPRKKGLMLCIFLSGMLGLCFIFSFVQESKIIQLLIVALTRFTQTYGFSLLLMLMTESFDPKISSESISLATGMSQLSKLTIPFLVTHMNDLNIEPILACSAIFLTLGLLPISFMKETKKPASSSQNQKQKESQQSPKYVRINEQ